MAGRAAMLLTAVLLAGSGSTVSVTPAATTASAPAPTEAPTPASTPTLPPTPTPRPTVHGLANVELAVAKGKYAGTYSMAILDGPGCGNASLGGRMSFDLISWKSVETSGHFDNMNLHIDDVAGATGAATGTHNFHGDFAFDSLKYILSIAPNDPRNTATIETLGGHKRITITAISIDGVGVSATILCR